MAKKQRIKSRLLVASTRKNLQKTLKEFDKVFCKPKLLTE